MMRVEKLAMDFVLEYEKRAGRKAEDVSKENIGFDIKSLDEEKNIIYIEVKGRASVGSVALSQNEWFKAQRLKDNYYLYVIWNAKDELNKKIVEVRNPAHNLKAEEREIVRFVVTPEEITKKGIS